MKAFLGSEQADYGRFFISTWLGVRGSFWGTLSRLNEVVLVRRSVLYRMYIRASIYSIIMILAQPFCLCAII